MQESFEQIIDVGDDLAEVGRVQEILSSIWETRGLPPESEGAVSLALEEALSNVLRHSSTEGADKEIRVRFQVDGQGFAFELSDAAAPYNPLTRADPDVTASLDERRPGGLGVFLLRKLADELTYARRDGRNHLRFRKLFHSAVSL